MKKIYLAFAASLAVACTSKADLEMETVIPEQEPVSTKEYFSVQARYDSSYGTKVTVNSMKWQLKDCIRVAVKSAANFLGDILTIENVDSGTFTGQIEKPGEMDTYYASYPATLEFSDVGVAQFSIPSEQDNASELQPMMVASCADQQKEDVSFTFKPVVTLLDIYLDKPVTKVIFEGMAGETLTGNNVNYDIESGKFTNASDTKVVFSNSDGVQNVKLLVPSIKFTSGYKLTITGPQGTMYRTVGTTTGVDFSTTGYRSIGSEASPAAFTPCTASVQIKSVPMTSYSYYLAAKNSSNSSFLNTANSMEASAYTAGEASVSVTGISDSLLGMVTYGYCVDDGADVEVGNMGTGSQNKQKSFTIPAGTFNGNGKHSITCWVKVNGSKIDSITSDPIYVTGLPSRSNPPTSSTWSGSAYNWSSSYVRLHNHTISKTFFLPKDTDITLSQKVFVRRGTVATTYNTKVSGTSLCSITPGYSSSTTDEKSYNTTMKSASPTVSCVNSYGNVGSAGTRAEVYYINVLYR